jgi:L-serine dehydratase
MSGPISVVDIFKIGIGPSSSHTLGPWRAALDFRGHLLEMPGPEGHIEVILHGSLAKTGRGHGTDIAVIMGLAGHDPVSCDVDRIMIEVETIRRSKRISLHADRDFAFDPETEIRFEWENLPFHPNGITFRSFGAGSDLERTYYSTGGGSICFNGEELTSSGAARTLPYPVDRATELLEWCNRTGLSISGVVTENERAWRSDTETERYLREIWSAMKASIFRGCQTAGVLPGGLGVQRRAALMSERLLGSSEFSEYTDWVNAIRTQAASDFSSVIDWVSCFALAVNEENASFGRIVTAPTNGSAGVIPAVLHYLVIFHEKDSFEVVRRFLLTAAEIGSIFKKQSTISAAMGGCQAEIGVSSSMAAAGLVESLGGSVEQTLMAAEIAMEHHLGLTCDPIGGLVQVPCIERNAIGAVKAISAARLALNGNPKDARVSLDDVVDTMWDTAQDMSNKYKETAEGGLAARVPLNLAEC